MKKAILLWCVVFSLSLQFAYATDEVRVGVISTYPDERLSVFGLESGGEGRVAFAYQMDLETTGRLYNIISTGSLDIQSSGLHFTAERLASGLNKAGGYNAVPKEFMPLINSLLSRGVLSVAQLGFEIGFGVSDVSKRSVSVIVGTEDALFHEMTHTLNVMPEILASLQSLYEQIPEDMKVDAARTLCSGGYIDKDACRRLSINNNKSLVC